MDESSERVRWILESIKKLMDEGFQGTLMIDFVRDKDGKSYPSEKYKEQRIKYAKCIL